MTHLVNLEWILELGVVGSAVMWRSGRDDLLQQLQMPGRFRSQLLLAVRKEAVLHVYKTKLFRHPTSSCSALFMRFTCMQAFYLQLQACS
jgi:hypothetical protein